MSELVATLETAGDPAEMDEYTIDDIGYYAARLFYESATEHEDVRDVLLALPDAMSPIRHSIELDEVMEEVDPDRLEQIRELALSGFAGIWATNYALHAITENDNE